jgi:Protein of unknown function (DUF1566)
VVVPYQEVFMAARRVTHIGRPASIALGAALMALFAALLLPGTALAVAKPGKPTAKAPTGTISTAKPTFKWSKAARATSYKVRVYEGSTLLVKKTGITGLSWKSSTALPKNVDLTWKVRARNAGGNGAWSRSLKFKIVPPAFAIGDPYGGGVVAYILRPGDPGYVANVQHGLIAAIADQMSYPPGIVWAIPGYQSTSVPGGTLTTIGTGSANTDKIIIQNVAGSTYAAGLARAYRGGGHIDWFLPSKDELHKLYLNRVAIGGFDTTSYPYYWSSSENENYVIYAWYQYFGGDPNQDYGGSYKFSACRVRAVRAF